MRLFKKSLPVIPISRVRHEEDAINFRFSILSLFRALVIVKVYPIDYEYGKAHSLTYFEMRLFKKSLIPISRVKHEEDAIHFRFSILSLFRALVIVKVYPIDYEYGKAHSLTYFEVRLFKKSLIHLPN
jgi:hypothetical protein